jgi:uncharacterized protein YndB with AHSA1/START domain
MPSYDVVTESVIDAGVAMVFPVFLDTSSYSEWKMPDLEERVRTGREVLQEGCVLDFKIHRFGTLTFAGRVTDIVDYRAIRMEFFEGDFVGTGEYTFEPINGKTRIRFHWNVRSNRLLISLFSRFFNVPEILTEVVQSCFEGLNRFLSSS